MSTSDFGRRSIWYRVWPHLVVAGIGASLASSAWAQSAAPSRSGGELAYGEAPGLLNLNPYANLRRNGPTDRVLSMIYEPLFRFDFSSERWENVLGVKVTEVAPRKGKSAFAVELKPGVVWHDGTPFSATDVVLTYDYLKNSAANAQAKEQAAQLIVETRPGASALQVVFEFSRPVSEARELLLELIIPAARFSRPDYIPVGPSLNDQPLGTGPYRLVEFASGNPVLRVNERYHGTKGQLERIRAREFPDQSSMIETILNSNGDINLIVEVPSNALATIEANRGITTGDVDAFGIYAVALRPQTPTSPLANERVRRALTMAVDREQILKVWFAGLGQVVAGPVGPAALFYDPEVKALTVDTASARREIEAAGAKGARLTFIYEAAEMARDQRAGNIVRSITEALEAVGLRVTEKPLKATEFASALYDKRDFDLAWVRWEFNPAYDITQLFHSDYRRKGGHNYMNFSDPQVDRLLNEYRNSTDDSRRQSLMFQVQRLLRDKAPAIFVVDDRKTYAYRTRLRVEPVDPFYFFTYVAQWWLQR